MFAIVAGTTIAFSPIATLGALVDQREIRGQAWSVHGRFEYFDSGDVISQGEIAFDEDGAVCIMPESGVKVEDPSVVVESHLDENCQEVVDAVYSIGEGGSPAGESGTGETWGQTTGGESTDGANSNSLAATRYRSGGWHTHEDVVNLNLTEAYADMHYYDSGSTVYGGHQSHTYCWNARDGWYGTGSSWNWSPGGTSSVSIWKRCSFAYGSGGRWPHTMSIDVYSWPGDSYQRYCSKSGSFVPGAKFSCQGRHWPA